MVAYSSSYSSYSSHSPYSTDLPAELGGALSHVLTGVPAARLGRAVDRLMASYRGTVPTGEPLLRGREDVVAYAAYRMPATYAAVRSALGEFAALAPHWRPSTHADVGGGTGAAAWAAADAWPDLATTTVLDWAEPALDLGRELAASSPVLGGGRARWRRQAAGADLQVPDSDLVTLSYVLGELAADDRRAVVAEIAARGQVVAVVEPGTPAGFRRISEARDLLVADGMSVAAPCPHSAGCPMAGEDWCHFAARLTRTAVHRQLKGGSLGYEDEKFAYVIATREPVPPAEGRVLRHPVKRKGMVEFRVCAPDGAVVRTVVTKKRHPLLYPQARDAAWGAAWPPPAGSTVEG